MTVVLMKRKKRSQGTYKHRQRTAEDTGRQLPPVSQAEMPQKKLDQLTPQPKTSCPGSWKMIAKVACPVALVWAPRAKHG